MADALLAPTSPIYVALDMTDIQRGLLVQEKLAKVQQDIWLKYRNILSPNTDPHYFRYPIVLEGDDAFCQPNNVNFVAPGVMIVMTFFLQSGLTSGTIILERSTGLWERNSVLGVTDSEIVLSHLLVMSFFAFFQSIISVILVYFLYAVPCDGSLVLVFILVFLQAINGEAFGFLCSVFARSITEVNFINLGLYYPIIHLSGVAWPLSGMSTIIRTIGYMCPLTYAIQAVRNIQSKGWGIFNIEVLAGFISSLVWIAIFCITIVGLLAVKRVR
ncbi:ABC transporter G family member 20-like [Diaphorina citri]|nr:ABC transporter G family member 20-like [Diaphorina citri]